jgi:hypothetical protein
MFSYNVLLTSGEVIGRLKPEAEGLLMCTAEFGNRKWKSDKGILAPLEVSIV